MRSGTAGRYEHTGRRMVSANEPGVPHVRPEENSRHGRLSARPYPPIAVSDETGLAQLDGPTGELLAMRYVPTQADSRPYRLVLILHGAGGSARQALGWLLPVADEHRLLLVAPKSQASTWDLIIDGYGPDVRRIDRILEQVFDAYPVHGLTIGGFSDGAGDRVLPIDRCSRRIVPRLQTLGYDVAYEEFDGGHEVPEPIVADGIRWLSPGTPVR